MRNANNPARQRHFVKSRAPLTILLILTLLSAGCIGGDSASPESAVTDGGDDLKTLKVWYTFNADSKEEVAFLAAVTDFEASNPSITIEATWVPFENADQVFMIAAQGGEAPDLVRLSNDQLGKIGEVRVDGYPLLEDLRPHLTPLEIDRFDPRAVSAMHYGDSLLGVPASQDCLSLIYNKALFDEQGIDYRR